MSKRVELLFRDPKSLTPYIKNAKVHSTEQIDKIAGQISAFGFDQPIVITEEGIIIKGHGRREAAIRLGMEEVPVIISTLDEYQAMASRIGDNKVAESEWDKDMLKFEFGTLELQGIDMQLTGFEDDERKEIIDEPEWNSEDTVGKTQEHTDGIRGIIKVSCAAEQRKELIEFLQGAVADSGFEGVEVE